MTLADIWHRSYIEEGNKNFFKGLIYFNKARKEKLANADEDLRLVYKANLKQLTADIIIKLLVGAFLGGFIMQGFAKDLDKKARENNNFATGMFATMAKIATTSVSSAALDFDFISSIGSPLVSWTPFSFETVTNMGGNILNTAFGDKTMWGGIINAFSATK